MPQQLNLTLTPAEAADPRRYTPLVARRLRLSEEQIAQIQIIRRSIDARGGRIKVNVAFQVYADLEEQPDPIHFEYGDVRGRTPVVVVGAGPAGLFAALRLIELGYCPHVIERGVDVSARKRDIAQIQRNGAVNPHSNYAFGEGGAGTYSDGKLYTRSKKRGNFRKALEVLHFHGAGEEILYEAHPHIGTDRLPRVIAALRESILQAGGEVHFGKQLCDVEIEQGRLRGVWITPSDTTRSTEELTHELWLPEGATPSVQGEKIEAAAVVLATGHSARDIYALLHRKGVELEQKSFAMGVRCEHPQELIDQIQYHGTPRGEVLPAAAYSLVQQVQGRGVYSFCMCPGGFIVPAMTQAGEMVVNGMSPSGRNNRFANAGIVTEVREADYAHLREKYGVMAGLRFQWELEQCAYAQVQDRQVAPAQRLTDFIDRNGSRSLPTTSYVPGVAATRIDEWMPRFMSSALRGGFLGFDRKMRGFVTREALLIGVESRTSSPLRIPRDPESLMHPQVAGLFPSGEGAGYAGGIISAAVDGERVADAVAAYLG